MHREILSYFIITTYRNNKIEMHTQIPFLGFGPGRGPGKGPNIMRQLVVILGCYVVAKACVNKPRGNRQPYRSSSYPRIITHWYALIYAPTNKKLCSIYIPPMKLTSTYKTQKYCVDVPGGLRKNNLQTIVYPCHNGPNQEFHYNRKTKQRKSVLLPIKDASCKRDAAKTKRKNSRGAENIG